MAGGGRRAPELEDDELKKRMIDMERPIELGQAEQARLPAAAPPSAPPPPLPPYAARLRQRHPPPPRPRRGPRRGACKGHHRRLRALRARARPRLPEGAKARWKGRQGQRAQGTAGTGRRHAAAGTAGTGRRHAAPRLRPPSAVVCPTCVGAYGGRGGRRPLTAEAGGFWQRDACVQQHGGGHVHLGATGKPKGGMIRHGAAGAMLAEVAGVALFNANGTSEVGTRRISPSPFCRCTLSAFLVLHV